ncbi:MetQ/NlpA family ABC transporter substrate-binding protein [Nesterenkonia xinjiangensis]|uniref:D-methionine transport system substrate-binding protein n=1 Tax=Nesterenkonia xinjiangensis TaxID=225327 RepID=A0A7Z0GM41_9MICC|nr:MetQ/NlpA family ABC transporter substrate-binding protein [Nesterenkonia xinjiangensis]NYJ78417.1 D-methionine transport system substrate-binding protein [Nesterenkonia xinjiangensis]
MPSTLTTFGSPGVSGSITSSGSLASSGLARRSLLLSGLAAVGTFALTSCGLAEAVGEDDRTISMIVTESAPFQDPTEIVKDILAEDGWTLETTYVTDIIQPNQVVAQGEFDANFFQHLAYLRQFNEDNGTDVEPAFSVYYAPSGIFSLQHDSIEDLPEGAQVALAVDTANNGRGIKLLADAGAIEIDESKDVTELSQRDITANPKDFEFIEVDQQSTSQTLPDVDAGFAFARLVAEAGHDVDETALILEQDEDVRIPFTCVVAGAPGFQDTEKAAALQEAFQSAEVQQWFDEYLEGSLDFTDDFTVDSVDAVWEDFAA